MKESCVADDSVDRVMRRREKREEKIAGAGEANPNPMQVQAKGRRKREGKCINSHTQTEGRDTETEEEDFSGSGETHHPEFSFRETDQRSEGERRTVGEKGCVCVSEWELLAIYCPASGRAKPQNGLILVLLTQTEKVIWTETLLHPLPTFFQHSYSSLYFV